ncbi:MAG: hypothetical protein K0R54_3255 [Clostridiaceae bacterium]|nr:hypothetical protein [Clostridiaceae bacterium]
MNLTSISLSYYFLGTFFLSAVFFIYFKLLTVKVHSDKYENKITGAMKDPQSWENRNRKMSYICLLWSILSLIIFIYLKFIMPAKLVSVFFVLIYIVLIIVSLLIFGVEKKVKA